MEAEKNPPRKFLPYLALVLALLLISPPVRIWHFASGNRWLYILLFSFLLSYGFTHVVRMKALRRGVLDYPNERKIHQTPTPLLGGIAIYLAFLCAVAANFIVSKEVAGILVGGSILVLVGIIDDRNGLSASLRLIAQVGAASIVIVSGTSLNIFPSSTLGNIANILLTLLWIIGITDAFNFFDGMDGLAPGLGIITAFFLGVLSFQTFQPFLGWLCVAIIGGCSGFLPYNFRFRKPASIFLGDSGGAFLGFTLSSLAIMGEWADNNPIVALSAPLLIFWVFIFDMVYITISRVAKGKVGNLREWVEYTGKDHLHHRLALFLNSEKLTVCVIFLITMCLGLSATALRYARTIDALLLILQAAVIVLLVSILQKRGAQNNITH
jgi:UDP-GlcNAc:undecaprenyl-phosphate GlcNAc-1-phosphate transferase